MIGLHLILVFMSYFFPVPQGPIFGGTSGGGAPTFTVVASGKEDCVSTFPCTLTGLSIAAGDAVRVDYIFVDNGAGATLGITDGGSSSYTSIFQHTDAISGGNGTAGQSVALTAASGVTSITMSITVGSPATHTGGFTWTQYHRTSGTWATDQNNATPANFSTTTSPSCNAITTTGNPSMAMAWIYQLTDSTHNFTGASSYTAEQNNGLTSLGYVLGSMDLIQTSGGSTTAAATTGAAVSGTCYTSSLK